MIEFKNGDILKEDTEALVNTVNCVGVMGKGIALQFKNAFPENFKAYARACRRQEMRPGKMLVFENQEITRPRYIINFPTKRHWRGNSRMEDIEVGLQSLTETIREKNIGSIAIPPLGAGLGGLVWAEVKSRIQQQMQNLQNVRVVVYEPQERTEAEKKYHNRKPPEMTGGRAALVGLIQRYMDGFLDHYLTLLEIHKLMYFLQEAGEPLQLRYQKAHYGPYAENLRHVLNTINGYLISGYTGSDQPDQIIHLVPGAFEDARQFLSENPETKKRFNRVSQLVEGFESAFGLELLATVHWVMKESSPSSVEVVIQHIHNWNYQKHKFTPRQISIAMKVLAKQHWIPALSFTNNS